MANIRKGTRTVGAFLSRFFLSKLAGMSFGSARDVYNVFGYARRLDSETMRDRVRRQDIVRSCLYKPAEAIWTNPPILQGSEELVRAWNAFVQQHQLWSALLRADKLLGVEPYVVLFLGVPGTFDEPVNKASKIAYIQPYGSVTAQVSQLDNDPGSMRFGRPAGYNLSVKNGTSQNTLAVHWSRAIHLTNELTDDNNLSDPRIMAAYNLFDDILKVTGGSAETFWLTANRGMQVDIDKDMELDEDEANALSDELDEFQHQLRRYIRTRGVKIENLGSEVADPRGVFEVLVGLLAGTYEIPQRVLMGSEAGQLASEQDRANWAETVQKRRISFAEPYILRPVVTRLQELGVLPQVSDYGFQWPEAFHMSPLERAQTMAQTARAVGNLSRQAQYGTPVTSIEEARLICGLPAEPASTDTMPEAPETKPTKGKESKKSSESEGTTTEATGQDPGNDGIADKKGATAKQVENFAVQVSNETAEIRTLLHALEARFSAAEKAEVQQLREAVAQLPQVLANTIQSQDGEVREVMNQQLAALVANTEAVAKAVVERPIQIQMPAVQFTKEGDTVEHHHHHSHDIKVDVAAAEAPTVHTHVAAPAVTVEPVVQVAPTPIQITNEIQPATVDATFAVQLPPRETTTTITTDGKGNVTGSKAVERDAKE